MILDLEREEDLNEYRNEMSQLDESEQRLQGANDIEGLNNIAKSRQKLLREGKYDELSYKLKKLQIQQRQNSNRSIVEQIREVQKQLDELYNEGLEL